jgi:hypothetical protein
MFDVTLGLTIILSKLLLSLAEAYIYLNFLGYTLTCKLSFLLIEIIE